MGGGARVGTRRGRSAPLVGYVAVQLGLLATSAALSSGSLAGWLNIVAAVIGFTTFTVGIARSRPAPTAGWWTVVASALAQVGAAVGAVVIYGVGSNRTVTAMSAVFAALSLPLLAIGLALLGRQRPDPVADILDSAMLAVGGFLLLWAFFIGPELNASAPRLAAAIAYPIGVLLVVTTGFKLILSGGLRDPALRLLLVSTGLLLVVAVAVLVPAIRSESLTVPPGIGLVWVGYAALLGATGLHPQLTRRHVMASSDAGALSPGRITLFIVLALIAPTAPRPSWSARARRSGAAWPDLGVAGGGGIPVVAAGDPARPGRPAGPAPHAQSGPVRRPGGGLGRTGRTAAATALPRAARPADRPGQPDRADRGMEARSADPATPGRPALLLLDLDRFKDINDTLGTRSGTTCRSSVRPGCSTSAAPGAVVARLGGDEFAVLLAESDPSVRAGPGREVPDTARRLRHRRAGALRDHQRRPVGHRPRPAATAPSDAAARR